MKWRYEPKDEEDKEKDKEKEKLQDKFNEEMKEIREEERQKQLSDYRLSDVNFQIEGPKASICSRLLLMTGPARCYCGYSWCRKIIASWRYPRRDGSNKPRRRSIDRWRHRVHPSNSMDQKCNFEIKYHLKRNYISNEHWMLVDDILMHMM